MSDLIAHIDGIGLFGPGLNGWQHSQQVLSGAMPFVVAPLQLPIAEALPAAERRRAGLTVKLSMALGFEAIKDAGADASKLANVFSSTGGDCENCHSLLVTLASDDRAVSPTRFHNSVHNAPAGYWSIATACMEPSTSLCAYDGTFVAALIEATTQAQASGKPCLMVAFDSAYPEPLYSLRPIPHPFGIAMVVSPQKSAATKTTLNIALSDDDASSIAQPDLESLRTTIPTARALPLMQLIARAERGSVVIEYLNRPNLVIDVTP